MYKSLNSLKRHTWPTTASLLVTSAGCGHLRSADTLVLCYAHSHASVTGHLLLLVLSCETASERSSIIQMSNLNSLNDYATYFCRSRTV